MAFEGFVTLKEAAEMIGRSTARTRQYAHDNKLVWKRDEMGHIMVEVASLQAFSPPERGNARAAGVNPNTHLRHARAALKLVTKMVPEGPAKTTTLAVLSAIVQKFGSEVQSVEIGEDVDDMEDEIEDDQTLGNIAEIVEETVQDFDNLLSSL